MSYFSLWLAWLIMRVYLDFFGGDGKQLFVSFPYVYYLNTMVKLGLFR